MAGPPGHSPPREYGCRGHLRRGQNESGCRAAALRFRAASRAWFPPVLSKNAKWRNLSFFAFHLSREIVLSLFRQTQIRRAGAPLPSATASRNRLDLQARFCARRTKTSDLAVRLGRHGVPLLYGAFTPATTHLHKAVAGEPRP